MRVVLALLVLVALPATPASGPSPVTCGSVIYPDGASAAAWRPKRVVLGVVAVPPAYLPQTVRGWGGWPYWSKSGLVIRAGSPPVVVRVPAELRDRTAITWGDGGPAGALRFESCPPSSSLGQWNPYAGGFLLESRSACVRLMFRVGGRSATVRFGVGKRCA